MKPRTRAAVFLSLAMAGGWATARAQDLSQEFRDELQGPAAREEIQAPAPSEQLPVPIEPRVAAMLAEQPQAAPEPPAIQSDEHGTRYLSGGVSLEERDQMRDMARGFPLRIVSARPDAALVPNVGVTIRDTRGRQVLSVPDAGPVLYVNLPPGSYKVSADKDGQVASRQITITGGQQRETSFFWRGQGEEEARAGAS